MKRDAARHHIRFRLGDEIRELSDIDPNLTLLRYLREREGLTGTKEGCAEGDCGACTVAVGEIVDGTLQYRAMNACILFLPMLDGRHVLTVEHLRDTDGTLHPAQTALIAHHGSQCGFCTPGFVMSLFALYLNGGAGDLQTIDDALAGNLCRCTGYGPIIAAAEAMQAESEPAGWPARRCAAEEQLAEWAGDKAMLDLQTSYGRYLAPKTMAGLQAALKEHPDGSIIAGATDVGLWVTKMHRRLDPLIDVTRVDGLCGIDDTGDELVIGAAVRYETAHQSLARYFPELGELVRRIGASQVRNAGTIGGNIANGSPIGDMPPALIALDARITLNRGGRRRQIALEDFFIGYGKQDRAADEFLESVSLPKTARGEFRCHKVSKRFDQDITAILGAYNITIENGRVADARIAYGGMAAIPKRARACENALIGQPWTKATVRAAQQALENDFTPLTDMRASAGYRQTAAGNLLQKYFLEHQQSASLRLAFRGDAA